MATLKSNEIEALMEATQAIHACRDKVNFAKVVVEAFTRLIRADRSELQLYQAPYHVETLHRDHPLPGDEARESWFQEHMTEHPIVAHALVKGLGEPQMLCDFVSQRDWRQTRFYGECCREPGDNYLLCTSATVESGRELSFSFNRRLTRFNERERLLLRLIQGHLIQAWKNLQHAAGLDRQLQWLERGMEMPGCAVVLIDERGRVLAISRRAVELLERHFLGWRGPILPTQMATWLHQQQKATSGTASGNRRRHCVGSKPNKSEVTNSFRVPQALCFRSEQCSLIVRFYPTCERTGQPALLSLEEHSLEADLTKLQALGLTPRQAQTLYWMAQGQNNREIAEILSVRPRTVDKFAEEVFHRLGVENRLNAALQAQELLSNRTTRGNGRISLSDEETAFVDLD